MNIGLKKAIFDYMIDNDEFQLFNATTAHFRQYIYTPEGEYCFGGKEVLEFIDAVRKLREI